MPALPDGMAAFSVNGEIRVVRNHEVNNRLPINNAAIGSGNHYDDQAGGGTTTLVIDPKTNELISHFVSLSGTVMNCAGGATPWGSWISCEETTRGETPHIDKDGYKAGGFTKPHGYCFEVPAAANTTVPPVPLKAMGRFSHEAVAMDPRSGIVYLTEDSKPFCGFYRFLPRRPGHLMEGGRLEILALKDKPNYNTRFGQRTGATFAANWVTIDDPDPQSADTDEQSVFKQGAAKGAAHFSKLEGCFADASGKVYFVSSNGGDAEAGLCLLDVDRFPPEIADWPAGKDAQRLRAVHRGRPDHAGHPLPGRADLVDGDQPLPHGARSHGDTTIPPARPGVQVAAARGAR